MGIVDDGIVTKPLPAPERIKNLLGQERLLAPLKIRCRSISKMADQDQFSPINPVAVEAEEPTALSPSPASKPLDAEGHQERFNWTEPRRPRFQLTTRRCCGGGGGASHALRERIAVRAPTTPPPTVRDP